MISDEIHIRLSLSKSQLKAGLILAIVLGSACLLHSETITLTTLYPSPSGIYRRLITTMDTFLARDGGKVTIGEKKTAELIVNGKATFGETNSTSLIVSGKVGMGTTSPQAALDVNGVVRVGNFAADPKADSGDGSLFYHTTKKSFLGLQGGKWKSLGGDGIKLGEKANLPIVKPFDKFCHCGGQYGTDWRKGPYWSNPFVLNDLWVLQVYFVDSCMGADSEQWTLMDSQIWDGTVLFGGQCTKIPGVPANMNYSTP